MCRDAGMDKLSADARFGVQSCCAQISVGVNLAIRTIYERIRTVTGIHPDSRSQRVDSHAADLNAK